MKKIFLLFFSLSCTGFLYAQEAERRSPLQHELFVPDFHPPAGNEFRSAKGIPGPSYWQNSASSHLPGSCFHEQFSHLTQSNSLSIFLSALLISRLVPLKIWVRGDTNQGAVKIDDKE